MSTATPSVRSKLPVATSSSDTSILLVDSSRVSRDFLAFMIAKRDSRLKVFCAPAITQTVTDEFDLVIVNMHTDSIDDLALAGQLSLLKTTSRDTPFVVIIDAEQDHLSGSLLWRFDMCGYILNSFNPTILAAAIKLICAGRPYLPMLPPAFSRDLSLTKVEAKASLPVGSRLAPGSAPVFTSRETDVLRLLRQAKANKAIAHELSISVNTAKVHVRNIMRKLRATNRTQVVIGLPPQSRVSMQ